VSYLVFVDIGIALPVIYAVLHTECSNRKYSVYRVCEIKLGVSTQPQLLDTRNQTYAVTNAMELTGKGRACIPEGLTKSLR